MIILRIIFIGVVIVAALSFAAFLLMAIASTVVSAVAAGWALKPGPKVPLRYNFRNLVVRWKTIVIMSIAFMLVITMLIVMMSFVRAMFRLTEESGVPGNVMVLSDGATDEAFSSLPKGISVESLPRELQEHVVRDERGQFLAAREVYVIVNHRLGDGKGGGRKTRFVQMRGVDDPELAAQVHKVRLQPGGRWFSPSGVQDVVYQGKPDTAKEVVVGDGVARTFGHDMHKDYLTLGDVIEIGPHRWIVVGIMEPSGSSFGNEIWAKDVYVGDTYGRAGLYSSYVVRTRDEPTAKQAAALVKQIRAEKSFNAYTELEYYDRLSQTNIQFLMTFTIIALIMAVGGVLGVMVTMFAAISQRTKDIGVLRLLGYTRWQILVSFLLESLVIALTGGLLGCALGYLLANGWTVSSIMSGGAGGGGKSVVFTLVVDPVVLGIALVFTIFMGAAGGLLPSLSAMRLRPLDSLR